MTTTVKQPLPVGIRQRPVVFRAWHIPTATMWNVSMFSDRLVYRTYNDDSPVDREDCVLMQQTEFTDWFGQPLYEGDILRSDMVQTPEYIADGEEEYSYYQYIAFYNGAFILIHTGQDMDANPRFWAWSESLLFER